MLLGPILVSCEDQTMEEINKVQVDSPTSNEPAEDPSGDPGD